MSIASLPSRRVFGQLAVSREVSRSNCEFWPIWLCCASAGEPDDADCRTSVISDPRRALILVGQAKVTDLRNNRLVRMLADNDEACAAWTERLEVLTLSAPELAQVLGWLSLRNLRAAFAPDVNLQNAATELLQIVTGNWYHIARLADILD